MPGAFHGPHTIDNQSLGGAFVGIVDRFVGDTRAPLDGGLITCDVGLIRCIFNEVAPAPTEARIQEVARDVLALQTKIGINANEQRMEPALRGVSEVECIRCLSISPITLNNLWKVHARLGTRRAEHSKLPCFGLFHSFRIMSTSRAFELMEMSPFTAHSEELTITVLRMWSVRKAECRQGTYPRDINFCFVGRSSQCLVEFERGHLALNG